jgi:hypothetical protein
LNQRGDVKLRPQNDEDSQKWKVETTDNAGFGFRNQYNQGLLGVNAGGWVGAGRYELAAWERFFLIRIEHGRHRFIVSQCALGSRLPLVQCHDYLQVSPLGFGGDHSIITVTPLGD